MKEMKRFLTMCILLLTVAAANATVRYVKTNGTTLAANAVNATSWGTACNDLQAVISASASGDEIWVAAGTYKPNSLVSTNGSANPTPGQQSRLFLCPQTRRKDLRRLCRHGNTPYRPQLENKCYHPQRRH